MTELWFDRVPMWAVFLGVVALVLVSIRIGFYAGLYRRKQAEPHEEGPVGAVAGAVLGLLAFILAFTFSIAASRFDARKQLLLEEVNAIGTTALRAELISEPHRTEVRRLLKRYVDVRLPITQRPTTEALQQMLQESEVILDELWAHAIAVAQIDLNSDIGALFVESMNQVIDLNTSRRVVALQYRILPGVWLALFTMTVLSMVMVGYQFGLVGRANFVAHLVLALTFSAVIVLIADLDRGVQGAIQVSQKPMIELQQKLNRTTP